MGDDSGIVQNETDKFIAASHPAAPSIPILSAPSDDDHHNSLALDLIPLACLNLHDLVFAFDSSFINPDSAEAFAELPPLREDNRMPSGELPVLSLYGHADPVGDDEYNKKLSGRRARAVYGLLTKDVSIWKELLNNPFGGDEWHKNSFVEAMRDAIGADESAATGDVMLLYMNSLFPQTLQKSDFLGRGQDAHGKADFQGCGEFNPLVILSTGENANLSKAARNSANQVNRRVLIYLYNPLVPLNPLLWPCPRASENSSGCRKRFFSDGEQRRQAGPTRREYAKTVDTFACRFYDRFASNSPCERPIPVTLLLEITTFIGLDPDQANGLSLILEDQSGNAAQTIPASAAKQVDDYIVFEVDPVMLPNPSRIRLSRPEGNEFLGDLFDPVALTRALHGRHIDLADGILGQTPEQPDPADPVPVDSFFGTDPEM